MTRLNNVNSVAYDTDLFPACNDVLVESISTHNLMRGDGRYTGTLYTQ